VKDVKAGGVADVHGHGNSTMQGVVDDATLKA
jgi:hypothetical protein